MLYNAQNKQICIEDTTMDYVVFGKGDKPLFLIPGLGDGLRTMKGMALPIALMYQKYAKDYRVYVFSRRNTMKEGFSTRDMANDLKIAMDFLGLEKVSVIGVSQGGMIAQWMAINHPETIDKLVLVVTCARSNEIIEGLIPRWKKMAETGNHVELMRDNLKYMYSDAYIKKNAWMCGIVGRLTKPRSYDRFYIMADACLTHDSYHELSKIEAKTYIIGGAKDKTLGIIGSKELHENIVGSTLKIYEEWGHALYEEAKDFNDVVLSYLRDERDK